MATLSTAPFVQALSACVPLDEAQLRAVVAMASRFASAQDLAKELLARNWLTAYQANQLLTGKGQELVLQGRYYLLDRLGGGGMGEVFKARDANLGRTVALKVIKEDLLGGSQAADGLVRRFQKEGAAAALLSHAHIIPVHDAGRDRGRHFLVMEYQPGRSLAQVVKDEGPFTPAASCEVIRQVACGLQHLHDHGMVHRDIKPGNLWLTESGVVKIIDFGLVLFRNEAMPRDPHPELTSSSVAMGSAPYMAPEQFSQFHEVDGRADLFSLGRTWYHLLTGQVPTSRGRVDDLPSGVWPGLRETLARLMAADRDQRFASAQEFLAALDALTRESSRVRPAAREQGRPEARSPGRQQEVLFRVLITGGALLLLLVAGGLGWGLTSLLRGPQNPPDDGPAAPPPVALQPAEPEGQPPNGPPAGPPPVAPPAVPIGGGERLLIRHTRPVTGVAFVPGKAQALSVSREEMVLWDLTTGAVLQRRGQREGFDLGKFGWPGMKDGDGPPDPEEVRKQFEKRREEMGLFFMPEAVAVSPDGGRAFIGGGTTLWVWDLARWEKQRTMAVPHVGTIDCCVAFHPDGRRVLHGNRGNLVRLFDATTGQEDPRRAFPGWVACFSGDGRRVLAGEQAGSLVEKASLSLFDLESGDRLGAFGVARGTVLAVALSHDGRLGLTARERDNDAVVWDLDAFQELRRLKGHTKPVTCVAIAGQEAVTGSEDGTVRWWGLADGTERGVFKKHTKAVRCVALSPDGRTVISGSDDQAVGVWPLPGKN